MCIFHKWEVIEEGIVTGHQYILGRDLGEFDYHAELQKCKKCGKERALIEDGHGSISEIAPWKLKEVFNEGK